MIRYLFDNWSFYVIHFNVAETIARFNLAFPEGIRAAGREYRQLIRDITEEIRRGRN